MRRFYSLVVLIIFSVVATSSVSMAANWERSFYKFANSIIPVASKIASQQKPTLQDTSENDEDMQDFGYPPVSYGRLWQKSKTTVVFSYESTWKGATLGYFETTDKSFNFTGGIRIGSTRKQVEKFFNEKSNGNLLDLQLDGMDLIFQFENDKVSRICFCAFEVASGIPAKIFDIIKSKVDDVSDPTDTGEDSYTVELRKLAQEFIKKEKIPQSVTSSGEIYIIRSYVSQFKIIQGSGAILFTEPRNNSKRIMSLDNGANLIADAELVGNSGGNWYYVHTQNNAKGWVSAQFITDGEPY